MDPQLVHFYVSHAACPSYRCYSIRRKWFHARCYPFTILRQHTHAHQLWIDPDCGCNCVDQGVKLCITARLRGAGVCRQPVPAHVITRITSTTDRLPHGSATCSAGVCPFRECAPYAWVFVLYHRTPVIHQVSPQPLRLLINISCQLQHCAAHLIYGVCDIRSAFSRSKWLPPRYLCATLRHIDSSHCLKPPCLVH